MNLKNMILVLFLTAVKNYFYVCDKVWEDILHMKMVKSSRKGVIKGRCH